MAYDGLLCWKVVLKVTRFMYSIYANFTLLNNGPFIPVNPAI